MPVKTQFGWHVIEVTKKTPPTKQTFEEAKSMIQQTLLASQQQTTWEDWLKQAQKDADVAYGAGFDPKTLTASPSPADRRRPPSARPVEQVKDAARRRQAPRGTRMSLTLVYIGAAAELAPAASLRALAGGGAVFVPAGLTADLRSRSARRPTPARAACSRSTRPTASGLTDLVARAARPGHRRARRAARPAARARAARPGGRRGRAA